MNSRLNDKPWAGAVRAIAGQNAGAAPERAWLAAEDSPEFFPQPSR